MSKASRCHGFAAFLFATPVLSSIRHGHRLVPHQHLIPEWNDLVLSRLWREALERLHKTNNFSYSLSRFCPSPCEGSPAIGPSARRARHHHTNTKSSAPLIEQVGRPGGSSSEPVDSYGAKKGLRHWFRSGRTLRRCPIDKAVHWVSVFDRRAAPIRIGGLLIYAAFPT